jgi:hypothetical protein
MSKAAHSTTATGGILSSKAFTNRALSYYFKEQVQRREPRTDDVRTPTRYHASTSVIVKQRLPTTTRTPE